jgi:hypothetical protein
MALTSRRVDITISAIDPLQTITSDRFREAKYWSSLSHTMESTLDDSSLSNRLRSHEISGAPDVCAWSIQVMNDRGNGMRPMRVLIAVICLAAPCAGIGGEYKVTDAWPSGLGEHFSSMQPGDRPICFAVKNATQAIGARRTPITCGVPEFYNSSTLVRPEWLPVDGTRTLDLAKTLERLFEDSLHWSTSLWDKPEFQAGMAARLRAHTLTTSTARVVLAGHNEFSNLTGPGDKNALILRYERWGCSESPNIAGPRVLFFLAEGEGFASLKLLHGLGDPDDLFLFDRQAYFTSRSERTVDSHWKPLKQPQPILFVHNVSNEEYFNQICNLIYWDREPSKTR